MAKKTDLQEQPPAILQKAGSLKIHFVIGLFSLFLMWWGSTMVHHSIKISSEHHVYDNGWKVALVYVAFGGLLFGGVVANIARVTSARASKTNSKKVR